MNFFERQADVRRLSRRLVFYFIAAVLGVVVAVDAVLLLAFQGSLETTSQAVGLAIMGAAGTVALIGAASAIHTAGLRRGGGGKVAQQLGGTPVPPSTNDPQLRRLRNIVEEIAIASSVPVPEIYVLEGEMGINAFAAGHSPSDAAIAVTTGTLERLNRRELEGVIAHEFSHIANGDMRLNMRLMGVLFGITVLAIFGRTLLRGGVYSGAARRRSSGKNDGAAYIMLVGFAAMVIGFIGVLMGRMIKAAVSRQREYLADASAVQFTRQTEGLTGALKKIGGISDGSELGHGKVDEVSHMLFGEGLRLSSMMATHPPLTKRIQALDPSFNPDELDALARDWGDNPPSGLAEDQAMGLAGPGEEPLPPPDTSLGVQPDAVAASAAAPTESTFREAEAILAALPDELRERAHDTDAALPLVLGLLLAADQPTRTEQHQMLVDQLGREVADAAWHEAEALSDLHPVLRLPLAEISFPALRQRSDAELQTIVTAVHSLVWADGQLTPHEYCLSRVLYRDLSEAVGHHQPTASPRHSLADSPTETATLLAVLATAGHPNADAMSHAYNAGITALRLPASPPYQPPADGMLALEPVWPVLDHVSWPERGRLVEALAVVASHDGVVTLGEWELLRMVCSMLHCPLPPQLSAITAPT